jgi:hypothetical protein
LLWGHVQFAMSFVEVTAKTSNIMESALKFESVGFYPIGRSQPGA